MKRKLAAVFILFAAMAMIPILTVGTLSLSPAPNSTADEAPKTDIHKEDVINFAAQLCGDDFCDEALKACIIIARGYLMSGNAPGNNNSDKEIYSLFDSVYNSEKELYPMYKGEAISVPYSKTSNGRTYPNTSLPYLKAVASPWDCLQEYNSAAHCEGISLNGINYLCQNGKSAEEAIMWYVPDIELSEVR